MGAHCTSAATGQGGLKKPVRPHVYTCPCSAISLTKGPGGKPVVLGQGGFGTVRLLCLCLLLGAAQLLLSLLRISIFARASCPDAQLFTRPLYRCTAAHYSASLWPSRSSRLARRWSTQVLVLPRGPVRSTRGHLQALDSTCTSSALPGCLACWCCQ